MSSPPLPPPPPPDPASREHDARLDRLLESDALLPLPLGLVSAVLARIAIEPLPAPSASDAGPVARATFATDPLGVGFRRVRPGRLVAMAAAALLAIGAGIGGLWTATTGDGLDALSRSAGTSVDAGTVASILDLATAARASTSASVRSIAAVPDQMPGSPAALAAGSLVLLGAAVLGARRRGGDFARGPEYSTGPQSDSGRSS